MEQHAVMPACGSPQVVYLPMSAPTTARNGLGAFGFFVSLVGLLVPTGLVSLLGLALSLAAIGRAPRGFATAGVIFGLLGSVIWLVIMIGAVAVGLVGALAVALIGMVGFVLTQPEVVEVTADMVNLALATEAYVERESSLPENIAVLAVGTAAATDPWGRAYEVVEISDEPGFDVVSVGPDGLAGTDDDIRLTGLDRVWEEAFASFEDRMEELGRRLEDSRLAGGGPCEFRYHPGQPGPRDYEADVLEALEVEALKAPAPPEAPDRN